jgi:hypothetical protein
MLIMSDIGGPFRSIREKSRENVVKAEVISKKRASLETLS